MYKNAKEIIVNLNRDADSSSESVNSNKTQNIFKAILRKSWWIKASKESYFRKDVTPLFCTFVHTISSEKRSLVAFVDVNR